MKQLRFERITLDHKSGTKDYHVYSICCAETKRSILIKRWGKVGAFGQIDVQTFDTNEGAVNEFWKVVRSKTTPRKGYEEGAKKDDLGDADMVKTFLGIGVFTSIGADALDHLKAGIDTTGCKRGAKPANRDDDGNWIGDPPPKLVEVDEAAIERERISRETAANAENPNFGIF
ncbi:WGR domain-containing protein [Aureimonas sp. AU40]|uniref:WGR domain-containing protein n=1 Tax=Aureimonas sp. AU40 TaxID=1637747 RepID=UPI000780782E|nr:WGR domain-containing protein [Aureimonas sp. AU40]